ncbi:MAG TPA: ribosome-associated translation inhibitor RaiA [Actinomycetota bacterium]|nr:ribosome-associated translation inhibitor RaiA [Actinomycetota bacterium]
MNVILHGRGVDLNDRLRGYATEKFTRVQRFFERITKMEVELSQERNPRVKDRHRVEVTVSTPGETLRAHGAAGDYFAAIDQAVDRLEIQVKKHKERRKQHASRTPTDTRPPLTDDDRDPGTDGPRIVRGEPANVKPMTPEEAIMELEEAGLQFLLFMSAETMRCAVVYRRSSGDYGLIEHPG